MSEKHTPGPWHISKHRDGRDMLVYGADDFEVARVCYPRRDENARLIAAAPDLLDALRGLVDALPARLRIPAIKAARAAIAKVEGDRK